MRPAAAVLALAALAACHSSPEAKARKTAERIASWTATAALADSLAGAGALPARYSSRIRAAAERGAAKARSGS
ncbi:MAG TPA: hypothetical protein VFK09_11970 [Gemmatimonadales bacterium]|jgi:hypothetical protein|nr:hypothetical protein [Gemmatimonadales bacterium]